MNSESGYKQRTKVFGIPVIGYKDTIWPELELKKYTIIENLLLAATRGGGNCVFDEGSMVVRNQEDGNYCVRLLATGSHCAATGMAGGAYFRVGSTLEWMDLEKGWKYYLYLKTNPKTFQDYTEVRAVASKYKATDSNSVLLGTLDITGDTAVLDPNPPGKVNARDLAQHTLDWDNPHGDKLTQDELTVTKRLVIQGEIEVVGETEKAIMPAGELLNLLKQESVKEVFSFTTRRQGVLMTAAKPVSFVSVSRSGTSLYGVVGEVSVEYYPSKTVNNPSQFVIRNSGDSGIEMKAIAMYE